MGEIVEKHVPRRDQINKLERTMAEYGEATGTLVQIETIDHFAPGLYAREVRIPAGTLLTGKIHKTEHLNVVSAGEITVWTEDGMRRICAPYTFVSKPGTKRVGLAHTDTVWTTFHVTEETDVAKIEADVIEPSDNLLGFEPTLLIEGEPL